MTLLKPHVQQRQSGDSDWCRLRSPHSPDTVISSKQVTALAAPVRQRQEDAVGSPAHLPSTFLPSSFSVAAWAWAWGA